MRLNTVEPLILLGRGFQGWCNHEIVVAGGHDLAFVCAGLAFFRIFADPVVRHVNQRAIVRLYRRSKIQTRNARRHNAEPISAWSYDSAVDLGAFDPPSGPNVINVKRRSALGK
jgi:hypothetical protein